MKSYKRKSIKKMSSKEILKEAMTMISYRIQEMHTHRT